MTDEGEPLKEIPESLFADDDGTADARLAQVLIKFSRGRGPLTDVVDALAYARVLVPVIASGEHRGPGPHGLDLDEVASTGVVAVQMPDGRTALPVFTDVEAMRSWRPEARPIPAEGPRAALAAMAEHWAVLVVNPGMETVVIPRPAVWALAQGEPWRPAVMNDAVDPVVANAIETAAATDDLLRRVEAAPGRSAEIAVVLYLTAGLQQVEVDAVVERVQNALAASDIVAARVDSVELRLAQF